MGDESARQVLMEHAYQRLRLLARKIVGSYPAVHRWEQTDDVLQQASVRLWKALEMVQPKDVREFFALASTEIRRELIDMSRHYFGPQGMAANQESTDRFSQLDRQHGPSDDPVTLSEWSEFHERLGQLAPTEREILDLLYYQGLPQAEAADILGMSVRTLKRRWREVRQAVFALLQSPTPDRPE
ncbi:MAG: RNA polymerase sigma factor [Pirellulaceae bacterium]